MGHAQEEKSMIIVEVMGGLGNQLQQYALYWKLKSLGRDVKLDVSWFEDEKKQADVLASRKLELRYFENLPMDICSTAEKEQLIGRDDFFGKVKRKLLLKSNRHFYESDMYHPEIFDFTDKYLTGFWACEKYYADILPELRKLIIFPNEIKNQNCENTLNIQTIQKNDGNATKNLKSQTKNICEMNSQIIERIHEELSVSIHIRRGDYLDRENAAMFGGICTEAYYDAAIAYMEERYPNAHFYLFSDDPTYAREHYQGSQYTVVDWNKGADSFYDIQLMSSCRHNICANSTFSFWGARLNPNPDKIMIRPAKHKNSQQIIPEEMHELWGNWILINEIGRIV